MRKQLAIIAIFIIQQFAHTTHMQGLHRPVMYPMCVCVRGEEYFLHARLVSTVFHA